ncbi:MAG: scpB [Solirubrobacterales bacterium]|nr:scpB [Solirubrobacterales bacterium]
MSERPQQPEPDPRDVIGDEARLRELTRIVEALLFVSPDPVTIEDLATACDSWPDEVLAAVGLLKADYRPGERGLILKEVAGGLTLATDPSAEAAARRLLAKPRTPPLTPAQAEALAIVAYLQPVSRPEMARIRGVSSDSATTTLLERGLIEEAGRSQFGAVLYRTTPLFLKLFGLNSLDDLPESSRWDPSPEEEADLRDRLLRAGEQRTGPAPLTQI